MKGGKDQRNGNYWPSLAHIAFVVYNLPLPLLLCSAIRKLSNLNNFFSEYWMNSIPNAQPMANTFFPLFLFFLLFHFPSLSPAKLQLNFYSNSCPQAEAIVRSVMHKAFIREPRSVASVMRFQFHDCFVNVIDPPNCSFFWILLFFFTCLASESAFPLSNSGLWCFYVARWYADDAWRETLSC